eukprot:jgi/Bigna1/135304/aug1.28_g10012
MAKEYKRSSVDVMIVYRKAKLQGLHVRRPKGREMAHPIVANSSVGRQKAKRNNPLVVDDDNFVSYPHIV